MAGPISSGSSPKARPGKKRCDRSRAASATPCLGHSRPTPASPREPSARAREGNRGTTLTPAWPTHTPSTDPAADPGVDAVGGHLHHEQRMRHQPAVPGREAWVDQHRVGLQRGQVEREDVLLGDRERPRTPAPGADLDLVPDLVAVHTQPEVPLEDPLLSRGRVLRQPLVPGPREAPLGALQVRWPERWAPAPKLSNDRSLNGL